MKRLIILKGEVETLDFFTERMTDYLRRICAEYIVVDTKNILDYEEQLLHFIEGGECVAFSFNNVGIDVTILSQNIWNRYGIPFFDFIVDHPSYFGDILLNPPCTTDVICLDKNHVDFVREFYPLIHNIWFVPNGGTELAGRIPYDERTIDVIYMGNCHEVNGFYQLPYLSIEASKDLFGYCIKRLLENDRLTVEETIKEYIGDDKNINKEHRLSIIQEAYLPIERYVRRQFKLRAMAALDKLGVSVDIFGDGWRDDVVIFSSNIKIHNRVSSREVLEKVSDAKISLCFIPWFKKGCSEKNFDSMLNGALCVSDRSEYLEQRYLDGNNIVFFDLNNPEQMAADVKFLLDNPKMAANVAQNGYDTAKRYDDWENRFRQILEIIDDV
ncbi:glycosyltransferase family protein [Butyrivibrio sp. YAB3001]|uniref:glycosyltransferase family protein n=1 Tax=Butyrivibrio sp. YAB3001 TaxID=1520812 RepID=UPI0008F649FA|nr:glycosyltransferase [Butyrivibrio sp. YAB3001]SFB94689.1 Glycosyl transferases group 1 [Butyrivibrio sp. YAB3001]